ncbi:methyltransferase domain-containing protein [Methylacidiphilum caldifontis]|uniref:tRNA (guanine(46)-N(7))-methyltransferase TrmB n=1 Tax=Methylacidiphilum caldifontis TaxID=2795386 RepID=UPI001A8E44CC|nr:methyltransferase domain-containing protein [Methylacidiphilum caldifontis]QSR87903.1 methyltransferase domain-containing protein [Methylacidiphilum caldifontis]
MVDQFCFYPESKTLEVETQDPLLASLPQGGNEIDSNSIFGQTVPFILDLGAGEGSFALAYALQNSGGYVLAIEKKISRVRKIVRKAKNLNLKNLKVLHFYWELFLKDYCKSSAVDEIHILFPDPWPKRRHHNRRTLNFQSIESISRVLKPKGLCRLVTDNQDYFLAVTKLFNLSADFELITPKKNYPESLFEQRFKKMGIPYFQALWEKKAAKGCP